MAKLKPKTKVKLVRCNQCNNNFPINKKAKVDFISCPVCLNRLTVNDKLAEKLGVA